MLWVLLPRSFLQIFYRARLITVLKIVATA